MHNLTKTHKLLIFVVIVAIAIYLLFDCNNKEKENMSSLSNDTGVVPININNQNNNLLDIADDERTISINSNLINDELNDEMNDDYDEYNNNDFNLNNPDLSERRNLRDKMLSRNSSRRKNKKQYSHSSYNLGERDGDLQNLDAFFNDELPQDYNASRGFRPSLDEGTDKYARYVSDKKQRKLTEREKFDVDKLLPKESNDEWFDDPYQSANVNSSHLINLFRPVAVNTIGNSLKNASHDIRGSPANPKYPVSPWSNSSIEPDINIKGNMLC